jgi:hypothetical protein
MCTDIVNSHFQAYLSGCSQTLIKCKIRFKSYSQVSGSLNYSLVKLKNRIIIIQQNFGNFIIIGVQTNAKVAWLAFIFLAV